MPRETAANDEKGVDREPLDRRLLLRLVARETMGIALMAVFLLLPAGRWDWPAAWVAIGLMAGWAAAMVLVVATRQPGLLADRLGVRPGTRRWDVVLLSLLGLVAIARCVVAGLDQRFHWSAPPIVAVQVLAAVAIVGGYALVVWATAVNAFFAATARIQAERGHRVISDGPYRFVRHPGYLGMAVADLALPVLLGSWWALIPSAAGLVVIIIRTLLEDRFLQVDLVGYRGYAARVRHRLLPGIW